MLLTSFLCLFLSIACGGNDETKGNKKKLDAGFPKGEAYHNALKGDECASKKDLEKLMANWVKTGGPLASGTPEGFDALKKAKDTLFEFEKLSFGKGTKDEKDKFESVLKELKEKVGGKTEELKKGVNELKGKISIPKKGEILANTSALVDAAPGIFITKEETKTDLELKADADNAYNGTGTGKETDGNTAQDFQVTLKEARKVYKFLEETGKFLGEASTEELLK
eukprot:CAMPEP_0116861262 /NCGR_PEP_ID=MMETSP0418-20121206/22925_1 /TAXON_ID=1158023 /ORGANISM="Astrosyne radiata, Strain 13vi08-1A" /LENGTH=224 /DNA_ID=CAMNT_0004495865 /DNA_START=1262 /DNA_END=1936 /DNA_ORIENTATION=-